MKKVISILLCMLMITACVTPLAGAVSITAGNKALGDEFLDGKCPGELDFAYFAPKNADKNNTKYPLVIFLHGNSSGKEPRKQVYSYDFTNFASDEYQSRFKDTNGAFLLLPRSDAPDHSWYPHLTSTLKKTIDYFISQNEKSIDTSRIYLMGLSAGGSMVYYMLSSYPDLFAAAVPMCSIIQPTTTDMDNWQDVSIWIHSSDHDYYPSANTGAAKVTFNYLVSATNRPDGIRMTNFSKAVRADGSVSNDAKREHFIWDCALNDMHMKDGSVYVYATTKNSDGATISFENTEGGFIDWLYQQKRPDEPAKRTFFDRILDFFNSFINLFKAIFGIK